MRSAVYLLLTLMLIGRSAAQADPDQIHLKVIRVSGPISEQMHTSIRLSLKDFHNQDPYPAGLIVLLDSPGGDGEAAMAIGRLLRQHHAHVFVARRCDSACVFLLMGGVVRAANPNTLGVHAGRLTLMKPNGQIVQEVDAAKSLPNSFQLAGYNRDIRLYLQEMGIGHGILDVMLAHQTSQVYKLTTVDTSQFRVLGFDNRYLSQRIQALDMMGYQHRINRIELFNRSMSVPNLCQASESSDRRFVDCYSRVLTGNR